MRKTDRLLLAFLTNHADLTNAISLNSSMVSGACIIGPSIAGVVMAQFGVASCYLIDGLSFLAVTLPRLVGVPMTMIIGAVICSIAA